MSDVSIITMANGETWWVKGSSRTIAVHVNNARNEKYMLRLDRTGNSKDEFHLDPHQVSSIRGAD